MDTLNPKQRVACSDIHVVKNDLVITHKLELKGEMCVKKYAPGCSEPYEVLRAPNAIQSAGKTLFLQLIAGLSTDHYAAGTKLKIYNATPTLVRTLSTLHAGPTHSSGSVKWTWRDGGGSGTYDSYHHDVHSPSANDVRWSTVANNFGTKNDADTWDYEYTLTISNGGDTDFNATGLDHLLRLMTGTQDGANHFSNNATDGITKMEPRTSADTAQTEIAVSTGPTVSGSTCSWEFVESTSQNNIDHYYIYIWQRGGDNLDLKLRKGADQLGTKTSSMERTITYQLSL